MGGIFLSDLTVAEQKALSADGQCTEGGGIAPTAPDSTGIKDR